MDGFGFRAALHFEALPSGRDVYRLYSWDRDGDPFTPPASELAGPTLRAECNVDDFNPGAGPGPRSDAHLACILCAFWSAFGPTVHKGRTDTHLLITRTTLPLEVPALALLGLVEGRPPGADASIGIR